MLKLLVFIFNLLIHLFFEVAEGLLPRGLVPDNVFFIDLDLFLAEVFHICDFIGCIGLKRGDLQSHISDEPFLASDRDFNGFLGHAQLATGIFKG